MWDGPYSLHGRRWRYTRVAADCKSRAAKRKTGWKPVLRPCSGQVPEHASSMFAIWVAWGFDPTLVFHQRRLGRLKLFATLGCSSPPPPVLPLKAMEAGSSPPVGGLPGTCFQHVYCQSSVAFEPDAAALPNTLTSRPPPDILWPGGIHERRRR
jgi:hypothetical protein